MSKTPMTRLFRRAGRKAGMMLSVVFGVLALVLICQHELAAGTALILMAWMATMWWVVLSE